MDNLDKKILAYVQENGRISLTELSDKVGLSMSKTVKATGRQWRD